MRKITAILKSIFRVNHAKRRRIRGENNVCKYPPNSNISFKVIGNNNTMLIAENVRIKGDLYIELRGDNCKIIIEDEVQVIESLAIYMHSETQNGVIKIGKNTSFYKTAIHNYDNDSAIIIGEDCMISYDTIIYNTDGHSIFSSGKLINQAKTLRIGNHCWLGWRSTVLKNSTIADNTIVAHSSLVSGTFQTNNAVLAGIPAKQIKENVTWARDSINETLSKA